jgi:hypothetical protein
VTQGRDHISAANRDVPILGFVQQRQQPGQVVSIGAQPGPVQESVAPPGGVALCQMSGWQRSYCPPVIRVGLGIVELLARTVPATAASLTARRGPG